MSDNLSSRCGPCQRRCTTSSLPSPIMTTSPPAASGRTLAEQVSDSLKERLRRGEWGPGERLPGEHELAAAYGVSRATIRSALRSLESLGLVSTRHGLGTFATIANTAIRADLRRLESLSATVASYGLRPGMRYRSRTIRPATAEERSRLALPSEASVVATERALTADGVVVAFSYDAIDRRLLPDTFEPDEIRGSLFGLLDRYGIPVTSAICEIHAVTGEGIGWGEWTRDAAYLLLAQTHYMEGDRPVMFSRTYFLEGRFNFSLVRTR